MLMASISSCHMLWYLHLCSDEGIIVLDYRDAPVGQMNMFSDGSGHFTAAVLKPKIVVKDVSMVEKAKALHALANQKCFIANSCSFPITHESEISVPSY